MASLSEHFRPSVSGYAVHRTFLRYGRLPQCCRESLADSGLSVRYLGGSGEEALLPLLKCGVCGRVYARCGEKYMPVEHPLKYELTDRRE